MCKCSFTKIPEVLFDVLSLQVLVFEKCPLSQIGDKIGNLSNLESLTLTGGSATVPAKGVEIGVKGKIGSGVSWKGKNYGLGMLENDRRYTKR